MVTAFDEAVGEVRSAMGAPPLTRSQIGKGLPDPKWMIGDALLTMPADERDAVAKAAGLDKAEARGYAKVAEMWPPETRREAAWSVHRELCVRSKIFDPADRFATIRDGMKVREAHLIATGKEVDRQALHNMSDDTIIEEMARLMLSSRRRTVIPRLYEALNASAEGRKMARASRSTAAMRRLDQEIRAAQQELKRLRESGSGATRFLELRKRLLDTEANVEEAILLWDNDRDEIAEEDWTRLGKQLDELGGRARHVAQRILMMTDVEEAEGWDDELDLELEIGGDNDQIVDAELVDKD